MTKTAFLFLSNVTRTLGTQKHAALAVPILFGIVSVLLGADTNWDLQNYHLYNAFALLNGKLDIDLAPAGFQTYFNPFLDVPYYLAMQHLPPRLVGFLMGALHGANFIILLGICRAGLSRLTPEERIYIPTLLALAGCLTVNFLSELGSSMGNNTTALFCMASILTVMSAERRFRQKLPFSWLLFLIAGLLIGIGTGLKLTNAPYALAVCVALFAYSCSFTDRVKFALVFGMGVLAGIACMNAYWLYTMWIKFGNPLFPQFNNIFKNPLAAAVAVGDTSWLPTTLWQQIFWPFIISADAQKVGQIALRQVIWAIVYGLLIVFAVKILVARSKGARPGTMAPPARFLIAVVVVGFFLWMKIFSIYRYMVPMDMLAPLAVFILCTALFPAGVAKRLAGVFIAMATLVVLLGGVRTWWHEPWGDQLLHAEVPELADPARTTVLMIEGDPPWAWLAIAFPVEAAFVQIQGNFPQGPGYPERVKKILLDRSGPTFVLLSAARDFAAEKADATRKQADRLGLTRNAGRCNSLDWLVKKLKLRASVVPVAEVQADVACKLEMKSKEARRDLEKDNRLMREQARLALKTYGLTISEKECSVYRAGIASEVRRYQWCPVARLSGN